MSQTSGFAGSGATAFGVATIGLSEGPTWRYPGLSCLEVSIASTCSSRLSPRVATIRTLDHQRPRATLLSIKHSFSPIFQLERTMTANANQPLLKVLLRKRVIVDDGLAFDAEREIELPIAPFVGLELFNAFWVPPGCDDPEDVIEMVGF